METQKPVRLVSLDAFRGLTIFGMVFVIAVAAGGYQWEANHLPQKMSWFGSLPVSTWFHADVGFALWERDFRAELLAAKPDLSPEEIRQLIASQPEANLRNIGLTITDLIAPWFVFIVGAVIPIGRHRTGNDWWRHVLSRTFMLIVAGVLYISLVIQQISIWWGVLQAIGVAYFCAALTARLSHSMQWVAVFSLSAICLLMTEFFPPWKTEFWASSNSFGTLTNPNGDWIRPLTIHCMPWQSLSYGIMAMIGVLVGHHLRSQDHRDFLKAALGIGALFFFLGFVIHSVGFAVGRYSLAFNKPEVTVSYAFAAAGLGAITFAAFFYLIDVCGWKRWCGILLILGVNPLLAYFMMIIIRRVYQTLGVVDVFSRVTEANQLVLNWAVFFGSPEQPAGWVLAFFAKGGYMGVFWGLVWTLLLTAVIAWCNRRNLYWKL